VASYLINEHSFRRLYLERTSPTPSVEKSATNASLPKEQHTREQYELTFTDAETLLDFITVRWREKWVTTDIWDESVLEILLRRPSFILVSVDAPVSVRWERFKARSDISMSLEP
jgi:dCMP deaminase